MTLIWISWIRSVIEYDSTCECHAVKSVTKIKTIKSDRFFFLLNRPLPSRYDAPRRWIWNKTNCDGNDMWCTIISILSYNLILYIYFYCMTVNTIILISFRLHTTGEWPTDRSRLPFVSPWIVRQEPKKTNNFFIFFLFNLQLQRNNLA